MTYDQEIAKRIKQAEGSYLVDPIGKLELIAVENFISDHDCNRLTSILKANSVPSVHLDLSTGDAYTQERMRNSHTHVLHPLNSACIHLVEAMSSLINSTVAQAEPVNLIRYEVGGYFKEHIDAYSQIHTLLAEYGSSDRLTDLLSAGNRTWTLMIYLNDDYDGGTTIFPKINIGFIAKKGSLVGWKNSFNSEPIANSLHAGEVVTSGEKYVAVIPFRERDCDQLDPSYYI